MKTYLLEAYNTNIKFDKNSVVVALTPEVCYQLDKVGIKYSIIEDYYDEAKLFPDRYGFLKNQCRWFKKFDKFLKDNVDVLKAYDLNLASIYLYHIKTRVTDPVIFRSFTLQALFDKLKPSSVMFVTPTPKKKEFNNYLGFTDKSLYAHLIPIFCDKYSIPFTEMLENKAKKNEYQSRFRRFVLKCKSVLRYASDGFRVLYGFFSIKNKKDRLNILQLNIAYNGLHVVIDALKQGHNPYILINNRILNFYYFGIKRFDVKIGMNFNDNVVYDWNKIAQLLENHELIEWINEKCSIEVSEIVLPNLKYFVSNVCPKLLAYFKIFIKFYKEEKIDFVLSSYMQSIIELAALSAANHYKGIKTVCVEHGDDVFENLLWRFKEITDSDICVVTNEENKHNLENLCKQYALPTKIYSSSNRLLNILKIGCLRTTKNKKKFGYNKIIYLPTLFVWDAMRIDSNDYLSPTRYYKFQKTLIEYFSKKQEYMFVWKGLLQSDAIYNPIPDFIRDNKFNNIQIATDMFQNHLLTAGKVICDFPSTGFYESVVAGVPAMSLYHKDFKVRKSAVDDFGNMLKMYSDIPEAIKHIDEFLNSDMESYITTIDIGDKSIVEILEENNITIF